MDLLYLLNSLFRKKWIIIFSTIIGIGAGVAFTFTLRKTYTALAQYSTGFTIGQKVKIQSDEALNIFDIDFRFRNAFETFRSPIVMGMVAYKLLLHDLSASQPYRKLDENLKAKTKIDEKLVPRMKLILEQKIAEMQVLDVNNPEEKKISNLLAAYEYDHGSLIKRMTTQRVEGSDYLNIWFTSENPQLSSFVVNELGVSFERFYTNLYGRRSTESSSRLDSLTSAKRLELDQITKIYENFRKKQGSPDVAGKATAAMDMVNEFSNKYSDEQAKLNGFRQKLAAINSQLGNYPGAPTVTTKNNNAEIISLMAENRDLAAQIAERGGSAPDLENKRAANLKRIQELTPQSTGTSTGTRAVEKREDLIREKGLLEADIRASEQNVSLYRVQWRAAENVASTGGDLNVIDQKYQSDVKMATDELTYLKGRQQAAQDMNVAPDINFKQTLLGQPPAEPDPQHKMVIVAAAGFAMLVLSMLLIILLDLIDGSLKTPSVFLRNTRLKLLSTVNKINLKKKNVLHYFDPNNTLEKRSEDEDLFVENIRKLRYEIEQTGKKIFLFTSNRPKEGKTTIMQALASSFSMSKKKILLIDSNFSNNTLTRQFDAKPSLQQFSLNGGGKNVLDKFWSITSTTDILNVDVVGCNEGNFTPSEILPQNNLLDNLRVIASEYDYIFIEGAALNNHADSKELSKYVDGIVSVFSSNSVIRQTDKDSIHFLRNTGNKYVGAVLNGVEAENVDL